MVDEYGAVQGMITVLDVLEAITGEFTTPTAEDAWAVRRADGSWLMDGLIPVPELKDRLELRELPEEDRGRYNTLAGMVMLLLGRLPGRESPQDRILCFNLGIALEDLRSDPGVAVILLDVVMAGISGLPMRWFRNALPWPGPSPRTC